MKFGETINEGNQVQEKDMITDTRVIAHVQFDIELDVQGGVTKKELLEKFKKTIEQYHIGYHKHRPSFVGKDDPFVGQSNDVMNVKVTLK